MPQLAIAADLDNLSQVRDFVEACSQATGISDESTGELLLAVDEAVTNIIMHGAATGAQGIELNVDGEAEGCVVRIRDNGPLFDPTAMVDPDLVASPLERDIAGGFGVYLFKHLVDETRYQTTPDGRNELTLVKRLAEKLS
jgi:serine/threonine-protein kinase RsbW